MRLHSVLLYGAAVFLALWGGSAWAVEPSPTVPGATLEELLIMASRQNPSLAAAKLDAEASLARQDAAGVLADPTIGVEAENMPSGMAISSNLKTSIRQELPLWGKRGLQREVAGYQAEAVQSRQRQAELELRGKVRVLYATRYAALAGIDLTRELQATVKQLGAIGHARYAQALGGQDEVITPDVAAVELEVDLMRLQTQADKAQARLNALLGRPIEAPLTTSVTIPPLPEGMDVSLSSLLDKAMKSNPVLAESSAQTEVARTNARLASRGRLPDINLGLSHTVYESDKPSDGVMAEVRVPLHWGAWSDEIRAGKAEAGAAFARRQAVEAQVQGDIQGAAAEYQTLTKAIDLLAHHHLPEIELSLKGKQAALANAKANLNDVLESAQAVRKIKLEILKLQVEQQSALAELETLTGGKL